jgi:hypothetical protein
VTPSPRPRPPSLPPVQYKGGDLDPARGPGLGCFWVQLVVLVILIVLTPIGVNLGWPDWVSALLLLATIGLLLVSGQTIIFLLRIVAAERREGRRRPMAVARTATVGELEDEVATDPPPASAGPPAGVDVKADLVTGPAGGRIPRPDADAAGADAAPPVAPDDVPATERVRE